MATERYGYVRRSGWRRYLERVEEASRLPSADVSQGHAGTRAAVFDVVLLLSDVDPDLRL